MSANRAESTDRDRHWQMRCRQVDDRERQLLDALGDMAPEEMRWTVRLLADALSPLQWRTLLAGYHEGLLPEQQREFLARFIPECTRLAILDLEAVHGGETGGLADLTDFDLQNISCLEKWALIAQAPRALDPARTARELARVAMCLTPNLTADPSLPRAAIEFSLYFRLQQALGGLSADEIYRLADATALGMGRLAAAPSRDAPLKTIRQEIGHAAGLAGSIRDLLGPSMEPLPRQVFPPAQGAIPADDLPAETGRELEALGAEELRAHLQLQTDQLCLHDAHEILGPIRKQYPDLARVPAPELRALVARLALLLRGRSLCDFFLRYRTGRFLALPPLSGEVWSLLPHAERLQLLEQDNGALDIVQTARHLAKFLLSPDYPILADIDAQRRLVSSPGYHEVVQHLVQLPPQDGAPGVFAVNRRVTGMALAMEESPREERGPQLEAIRRTIGEALGIAGPSDAPA
jgi:hypothetical protein